jgi:choline transport protein
MSDSPTEKKVLEPENDIGIGENAAITLDGHVVNASGHRDQLTRQYGLLSICGLALNVDNAWVALGTSLAVSIGQ